nr:hypothetical protein [Tanacetum cinerariifolium]
NIEDKILVPKLPENYARCAKCGHPVNGPYCQGRALLRERLEEDLIPACCDDDDDYDSAITPVLSTVKPIDSLRMGDEHLDTIPATESDEDDNLCEKLLNVYLLIANIEALKDNPTQSSKLLTKSYSTSLNSFLEETNTFHNSFLEFENFYFDLGEISSGSTTTHSDISLSEYDSFIFDLTHEEFGELMSVLNSGIRENLSTTSVNLPIEDDHSSLLAYVVWIFVVYLTYPVIPSYLYPFGNEDTIFDPGITINHFYSLSTEEPIDSLSMGDENLDTIPTTGSDEVIKSSVEDHVPIPSESEGIPEHMCDVPFHDNSPPLDVSKDQIKDFSESNNEVSSIDDDSFSIDNIDYVEASPPDSKLVSLEVMKIVIPEVGGIDDDIPLTIKDDNLREKLLNETNTFHNSLPEFENFYFDLGEISSGSTTTHSDISLSDYEVFSFNNDHVKEISRGSPTTQSDISLFEYDSFIFDFTHEEFADELAHIISPPEYDCFYF